MSDPMHVLVVAGCAAAAASMIGAVAGFAGNLFFVAIVSLVLGPRDAMILALLSLTVTPIVIVAMDYQHIERRRVALMLAGAVPAAVLGILVQRWAPEVALQLLVGLVALAAGLDGLRRAPRVASSPGPAWRRNLHHGLLPLGGFVHGAVGTGGPAIVAWLAGEHLAKSSFRSTICAFWVIVNPLLVTTALASSAELHVHLERFGVCAPVALAGTLVGNRLHRRLDPNGFRRLVAGLLAALGAFVLARAGW